MFLFLGDKFKCMYPQNSFNNNFRSGASIRSVVFQTHLEHQVFSLNAQVLLVDATHCVNNVGYNCFEIMAMNFLVCGQMVQTDQPRVIKYEAKFGINILRYYNIVERPYLTPLQ